MKSQKSPKPEGSAQPPVGRDSAYAQAFPPAPLWHKQPPHADPGGRFRPAPFAMRARIRYFVAVAAAAALMLGLPQFLNTRVSEVPPPAFESSEQAFDNDLTTFHAWPLVFPILDGCTAFDSFDALRTPKFHCREDLHSATIMVVGMNGVNDRKLAVDRAIRVLKNTDHDSVKPQQWTDQALEIDPDLQQRTGATEVWLSGYYQFAFDESVPEYRLGDETLNSPDPFHEVRLNRALSFYQPDDPEDPSGSGRIVTLQVTTEGVDAHRDITKALIKSAALASEEESTEETESAQAAEKDEAAEKERT